MEIEPDDLFSDEDEDLEEFDNDEETFYPDDIG